MTFVRRHKATAAVVSAAHWCDGTPRSGGAAAARYDGGELR